jgi:hypothetical protein
MKTKKGNVIENCQVCVAFEDATGAVMWRQLPLRDMLSDGPARPGRQLSLEQAMNEQEDGPAVIWIPTFGTGHIFDEWFDDPGAATEDDIEYIRADIARADNERLNGIIEKMSGELADLYVARDEMQREIAELGAENEQLRKQAKE